jgi:tetratricopeptide (TPR) repeat protein
MNFLKNFGLKSSFIIGILIFLILGMFFLWTQHLLPLFLFVGFGLGCLLFIVLNVIDRKNQLLKLGEDLIAKGEDSYKKGEVNGAIRSFERSIELKGPSWGAYLGLGHCYRALNDYKKAGEFARKALDCKGDSAVAMYLLGIAHFRLEYPDSAIKQFENALRINPELVDCHMMMGEVLTSLGKKEDAIKSYAKYLETSKDDKIIKVVKEKIEKLSTQKS